MAYFFLGLLALGIFLLVGRWYAQANTHDVVQGVRTFVAVFSALASTGLLFAGRFGLALITLAAMIMAIRAVRQGGRGADPLGGGQRADPVEIETGLLRMRLDRETGDVSGEVKSGRFAGSDLATLTRDDLVALLADARGDDPRSGGLLEAYLDRRFPDWREAASTGRGRRERGDDGGRRRTAGNDNMDEAEALEILGLERGAAPEEIRQAHRRLMAKLHPDSGGSNFLATQINRAKDSLLAKVRGKRR